MTVEHRHGVTRIDQRPKRVVTLGYTDHDPVLALGVKPVGLQAWIRGYPRGVGPFAEAALGDAKPEVFSATAAAATIPFERVAALRPDLIVIVYKDPRRGDFEKLSKIAPTIAAPKGYPPYGEPWQETTKLVGAALGKKREAADLIRSVRHLYAKQRGTHPEFADKTAAFVMAHADGGASFYTRHDARMQALTALGFEEPRAIAQRKESSFSVPVGPEEVGAFDADLLLVIGTPPNVASLQENPLFQRLEVARSKRVIVLNDAMMNAFSHNDVLSTPWTLDRIVPELSIAAKKAD